MPFLGKTPTVGNFILLDSITVSNTATFALTKDSLDYYPGSAQNMIVSVNGVTQAPLTAYTITDSNITFASALDSDVDVIDYILVLGDTLNIGRPSDSTVGATQLQDYAVTSVKMSNTGVSAATYGTSTSIPQITIDAAGRITSATGIDRSNQFEDLTVTGNLTVSGNTVTVDAQTLSVEDPLIHLAANNETSDVVDIGFVGHYSNDGGTTKLHTGFFRDASDEQYYLFNGFEDATLDLSSPSTTIDRTANTFTLANLIVNKLGIGTDNLVNELEVSANQTATIRVANETDSIAQLVLRNVGSSDGTISQEGGDMFFQIAGDKKVALDSDGNVGIGVTVPAQRLDVREEKTGGGVLVQVYNTDNSDTTTQTAGLALGPDSRGGTARITAVKENADFSTNAGRDVALTFSSVLNNTPTEYMRLTSAGLLDVGYHDVAGNRSIRISQRTASGSVTYGGLEFFYNNTAGTTGVNAAIYYAAGSQRNYGELAFHTGNAGTTTERVRIERTGNVGIGTEIPNRRLTINQTPPVALGSPMLQVGEALFTASGYYGIGLGYTAASYTNPPTEIAAVSISSSGGTTAELIFATRNVTTDTAPTERMRIDVDGNVGIGVSNPDARLSVTTDQQLIARLKSSNTGITGVRLEGIDDSAADAVFVDWFYDAENRQYGFGEGTSSGTLPLNSGVSYADIIFNDGNVRIPSEIGLSSLAITTNPLTLGNLSAFNLAFDSNEIQARNNGNSNNLILNKNGGTVGIGTTSTTYRLEVESTGDSGIRYKGTDNHATLFLDSASGYGQYLRFSEAGTNNWWIVADTLGDLNFRPNASSTYSFRLRENYKADFVGQDTTGNASYYGVTITAAQTGSDALTADRTHASLFINTDNSQSGGDTADEIRSYGVYSDTRITADADLCVGVLGYARSDKSSGTTTNVRGGQFQALGHDNAGGIVSNIQGLFASAGHYQVETTPVVTGGSFLAQATATGDGGITNFEGVRAETQVDSGYSGTIATGFTLRCMHDNNNGSTHAHTTHYLMYGDYTGTLPTTARGLWINDDVPSRFSGDLHVNGTLTKTSGSFLISHPLPSMANTHDLVHAFVESPQPDNIYSGMVTLVDGSATINIDTAAGMTEGTFVLLNKNIRRTVTNEEGFTAVKSSLSGNILTITAQDNTCTDEIFWIVIGQRNDAEIRALHTTDSEGNLIVEPEKGPEWVRPDRSEETTTTYDPENPFPDQE